MADLSNLLSYQDKLEISVCLSWDNYKEVCPTCAHFIQDKLEIFVCLSWDKYKEIVEPALISFRTS